MVNLKRTGMRRPSVIVNLATKRLTISRDLKSARSLAIPTTNFSAAPSADGGRSEWHPDPLPLGHTHIRLCPERPVAGPGWGPRPWGLLIA